MALKQQPQSVPQEMASFREVLEDCHQILTGLGDRCQNIDEVTQLVNLALTNDGQLTILHDLLVPEKK